jgi:hypothetical protein
MTSDGLLDWSASRLDEIVVRAKHEGAFIAWKELEVAQDGARLVEGCRIEEVIGEMARPMNALGLTPVSGESPVLEGREVRNQLGRERLAERMDIREIDPTGNGEKDGEQRKVRVRVIELETRAARWLGRWRIGARRIRGRGAVRCGARDLIRLGAWEEGEQEFLASRRRRTDESDKPLVDTGAVVRTVLGERHDVGVVEDVDDTATDRFVGLRDLRVGQLIDEARVHEGEALIGVRVVEDGAANGRRGVDSEELLESAVRGGDPRGATDGEGLEEALSALLADALTVLLSGSQHDAKQRIESVEEGQHCVVERERERGERERNVVAWRKTTDSAARDAEFGRFERSGAFRSRERATGSVHGD